jgi:branched-chain amino acid transport system permease protein
VLQQEFGISPWIGLVAATATAAIAALLIGVPTLRLTGIYFGLATLAYPLILQVLFTYWGYQEALIPTHPENPFLFMTWPDLRWHAALFGAILALCWIATLLLERSHLRYLLTAVREDEATAASVGIDAWQVKLWAFVISGSVAGMLGVIYAQMLFVVTPENMFGIFTSVQPLVINLVGGIGHPLGPLLGTLIIVPLTQWLDAEFGSISGAGQLIYGSVLIVVILLMPRGLIAALQGIDLHRFDLALRSWFGFGAADELRPPPTAAPAATLLQPTHPSHCTGEILLKAERIGKTYGGVIALRDINLEIRQHEFVGIVGPNGAGKTTLFDLLTGFQTPTSGVLRMRGEEITGWSPHRVSRRGIRRTFQVPRPFGRLTVHENVMLGGLIGRARSEGTLEAATWHALRAVGLASFAALPANALGPSQVRLLEVARGMVSSPTMLLLDEPLAGLDPGEVVELVAILRAQQAAGLTIVLVDHAVGTVASIVDRMIVLDNGALIADDTPDKVGRMPRVIEAYLGTGSGNAGN